MQEKLMKLDQYSDGASSWRVACDCKDPDHDVHLWFTPEEDLSIVSLNLSMEIGFYNQYHGDWRDRINGFVKRVKHAAKVLFTGYATMQGDVILDEAGMQAMQVALKQGLAHAKAAKKPKAAR